MASWREGERETIEKAAEILTRDHGENARLMLLGAMLEVAEHPARSGVTARGNWRRALRALGETCLTIFRTTRDNGL